MRKRSVTIMGHRTSVSIEDEFWEALRDLAAREGLTVKELIARVDSGADGNLSSALRLHVLRMLREKSNS
ncbi:MAG: ribbon-helix-helix domain-containing protein [Alphaproteobacteria bacterium]